MSVDKNQAVIDFLLQADELRDNPLFFNYVNGKDDNNQLITSSNDTTLHQPYVDGSVMRQYTLTLIMIKSISTNALVTATGFVNENVEDIADVQSIIDWLNVQADEHNYPNFGDDCIIDSLEVLNSNPELINIDTSVQPPLAQYSITIQINYIDTSKMIWK